jgi:hypothetical protein
MPFARDYFTNCHNVVYQQPRRKCLESPLAVKHKRLHRALAEVVGNYGLLNFVTLDIASAESVGRLLLKIDKCDGYVLTESIASNVHQDLFKCAIQSEDVNRYTAIANIRDRIASPDSIRELESNKLE